MNLFNKTNLSLMNKIILAFVAYMVLILAVFSVIVVLIDRGHVRSISDAYSVNILEDRSRLADQWLNERIRDVEVLGLTDEVQSMNPAIAIPFLQRAVASNDTVYARYYMIDTRGNRNDTLEISTKDDGTFDFSGAEADSHGFIVTSPKVDPIFKQATIEVQVPVMEQGRLRGIIGATVLLRDLADLVSKEAVYNTGYSWVMDGEGRYISHPNPDNLAEVMALPEDSRLIESIVAEGSGEAVLMNPNGETEYLSYRRVNDLLDWYMVISLYSSDVYSTVRGLIINLAIIFIVVVIISGGVSWFLAKDITGPIESLIDVTTKFTAGVKGIRANVDSKDEIGALATSFNNMADTIVAHTDNLEELIKERTAVLADLNYQIISRNKELGTMNEELERTNNKLHELASTDMLTGLQNRHEFQRELQKTMELVNDGREESFALLFIDLDNFKYYNDTFSHEIGDFLLQEVSKIMTSNVRSNDVVGRYGGDEFVILLREGDYEVAKNIAQRIHGAILGKEGFKEALKTRLKADVKIMGKNKLSSSIGIVKYMRSMNMNDAEALLGKADETMYKAKKQGKSRVVVG